MYMLVKMGFKWPVFPARSTQVTGSGYYDLALLYTPAKDPIVAKSAEEQILADEWNLLHMEQLEDELNINIDNITSLMDDFNEHMRFQSDKADKEQTHEEFTVVPYMHNFAPYSNKTMCYLDILDNLPQLRFLSSQMKMILWIMFIIWDFSNPQTTAKMWLKGCIFSLESWSYTKWILNVNHQIDKGEDLSMIWTPFWMDNVSGARSKQY
ncbi:hypothetical protein EV421DRAFT_1732182 [Armillaria borealis]|uniref:Uncharacterized protein n=1 Tax=Armillaria borealis TaxID=47425 RepID=A0AA39JW78_9AGAR|nr:hypothetical protein EV421DRAFT_1732182 [Armillaria borealis]